MILTVNFEGVGLVKKKTHLLIKTYEQYEISAVLL